MKLSKLLIVIVAVTALLLTACDEQIEPLDPGSSGQDPNEPVSSDDPTPEPTEQLSDDKFNFGEPSEITNLDIAIMESFPLQAMASVSGYLADGCTFVSDKEAVLEGNTFTVNIITAAPRDEICTQQLVEFTENVPLDIYGLKAGTYTVVAGNQTATFEMTQDNILPDDQLPDVGVPSGRVYVNEIDVSVLAGNPVQAQATIQGDLSNGCVRIEDISVVQEGNTFHIFFQVNEAQPDIACTEALVPFTEEVSLPIDGLSAGTYKVVSEGVTTSFTLDQDVTKLDDVPETADYVTIDSLEVNLIEGSPQHAEAHIEGIIACGVSLVPSVKQTENIYLVTVDAFQDPRIQCIVANNPYQLDVPLDILNQPAGEYLVKAGELETLFTLDKDNFASGLLPLDLSVVQGQQPNSAEVTLTVQVPNGCTGYLVISEGRTGNSILLSVSQDVPPNVSCLTVITEETVTYTVTDLQPGNTYTIQIGGGGTLLTQEITL